MPLAIQSKRTRLPIASADPVADFYHLPSMSRKSAQHTMSIHTADELPHRIDLRWLQRRLAKAVAIVAESETHAVVQVDVRIVGDAEMMHLHRTHSGVKQTTDVLTFDHSDEASAATIHADIAVCADEAARRAAELGHSIEQELLLYMIHGVLHCVGYDDRTTAGFKAMHAEEDRILREIGVGDTFHSIAKRRMSARGRAKRT